MINQETIDRIRETVDIVEIVNEYVSLKRRGRRYSACCPFHNEKTPSFFVFQETGTYKCFSCGEHGDAIAFLMKHGGKTYIEAIRYLAQKYNIELKEEPLTAEQMAAQERRENMMLAYDILQKEYEAQLQLPENVAARNYAYRRWGEEYCRQIGVGFCPKNSRFVENSKIPYDVVEELGLLNSRQVDFYNGRITIPIRTLSNKIVSFTARSMEDNAVCKYLNSKDSPIYSKSKTLFGINAAAREARLKDMMYLVEGAPDCMRLQSLGVNNTVAALGGCWSEDHFAMIKRYAHQICFIPDSDVVKEGQKFGKGVQFVLEHGAKAVKAGFSVYVKEIPALEKQKVDADEYFTSMDKFENLEERDFIEWYTEHYFEESLNKEAQTKVIGQIAELISYVDNPTKRDLYLEYLQRFGPKKRIWNKAISEEERQRKQQALQQRIEKEEGLLKKFGFNIEGNHYYSLGTGNTYPWSNFVMTPLFHIKDNLNPKRLYYLINENGTKELVELRQEDLVSLAKFKQKVEGLGNFVWLASEKELTKLKQYLYENTETAVEIRQMGWQRSEEFYAFGNGIFYKGSFFGVDDFGIVRLDGKGNCYLPAFSRIYIKDTQQFVFERKFVYAPHSNVSMRDFTDQIFTVFGNNGRVGFCFLLAALFRDVVTRHTRSFPILNLFGPKGSGKSEMGHTLMSFFIANNIPPNIQNATIAALNDAVAAVSNALVHIDEFKNDIDLYKREFLKGLWDGTGRTRKNMDTDKKVVTTAVDCGIILSGQEMATADIALFSRLIYLTFPRSEFTADEKSEYQRLKKMRAEGMSHLTAELLSHRHLVEQTFYDSYMYVYDEVTSALESSSIEDRILLNWLPPLAMFRTLSSVINVSITYEQMLVITLAGIKAQNAECRQNNELGTFWNVVQFLVSEGELVEGGDFRIQYVRQFKSSAANVMWLQTHPVLYLQKSRIFMLYKKYVRSVGDTALPEGSLKYYLENSKAYLGEKPCRFNVCCKGVIQLDTSKKNSSGSYSAMKTVQRSFCFDYGLLKSSFNINLERKSGSEDDMDDSLEDPEFVEDEPDKRQTLINFD